MAALEAMWETEPAPASFNLFAIPIKMRNEYAIHIPYVMGIIGTHSLDTPIPGIKEIIAENEQRIDSGRHAVVALEALRKNNKDTEAQA